MPNRKPKPNRKSIPVTITVDKDLLATIDGLADAQNLTRSQFIERQVRNGIEQEKFTVALLSNKALAGQVAKLFASPGTLKELGKAAGEKVTEKDVEAVERVLRLGHEASQDVLKKGKGQKA